MKNCFRKGVSLAWCWIFLFVLCLVVGFVIWFTINNWGMFAAALIIGIVVGIPINLLSGELNKIYLDKDGIKEYSFKKQKLNIKWEDVKSIKIVRYFRALADDLIIEYEGSIKPLKVEYRKKSKEVFLNNCPRADFVDVIKKDIEEHTYRYTGQTRKKKQNKEEDKKD